MLKVIFFKMLWDKRRDYIRVVISGIFIVAMVYFSIALGSGLVYLATGETADMTSLIMEVEKKFVLPYFLLIILMIIILIDYARKKSSDYAMLIIFGMKKKHTYLFVLAEFFGITLFSIVGGLCIGSVAAELGRKILEYVFADITTEVVYGWSPLKLCLIISVMIFTIGFVLCEELISCMGIDYVVSLGNKSGKAMKKSTPLLLAGFIIAVVAMVANVTYWGQVGNIVPMVLMMFSVLLLMVFGWGYYLLRLREKSENYYKKLLYLTDWYHHFFHHVNLTYIVSSFFIITIFGFQLSLMDNLPVTQRENYPYDLVWSADEQDINFLDDLSRKYDIEIHYFSSMRITSADFGEHTGIPESTYEELTNNNLALNNDEIYVVHQRDRSDYGKFDIDYSRKMPRLYLGTSGWDIWVFTGRSVLPSNKFHQNYSVVGKENNIITGNFKQNLTSDSMMKTDIFENLIVFSNEEYERIHNNARGSNLTVLMNIAKDYEKVTKEVYEYAEQNSQINFWDYEEKNIIYEKKNVAYVDRENKMLNVCAAVINMLALFVCGLFTLLEKAETDYEMIEWKYIFFERSGMSETRRKKYIFKEVMLSAKIAVLSALPFSLIMMVEKIICEQLPMFWIKIYCITMLGMTVTIGIVSIGIMALVARKTINKIRRRTQDE